MKMLGSIVVVAVAVFAFWGLGELAGFEFSLVGSLVASVVLTVVLNLVLGLFRRR